MLLFSTLKTPEQEGTQFCGDRRALGGANTVSLFHHVPHDTTISAKASEFSL